MCCVELYCIVLYRAAHTCAWYSIKALVLIIGISSKFSFSLFCLFGEILRAHFM